jgi:hypothetical protein
VDESFDDDDPFDGPSDVKWSPLRESLLGKLNVASLMEIRRGLRETCKARGWAMKLCVGIDQEWGLIRIEASWRKNGSVVSREMVEFTIPPAFGAQGAIEELKARILACVGERHQGNS